jgi:hypothetical protein
LYFAGSAAAEGDCMKEVPQTLEEVITGVVRSNPLMAEAGLIS